jgi:hypothetical protein
VHESVLVPDPPTTFVDESVHDRLVELAVTASVTVPVNPLTGETVIVEDPVTPVLATRLVGLADMVKSGGEDCVTETETVAEWERDPLVPVIVTV